MARQDWMGQLLGALSGGFTGYGQQQQMLRANEERDRDYGLRTRELNARDAALKAAETERKTRRDQRVAALTMIGQQRPDLKLTPDMVQAIADDDTAFSRYVQPAKAADPVKMSPQRFMAGGKPVQGSVDESGKYYDSQGRPMAGDILPYEEPKTPSAPRGSFIPMTDDSGNPVFYNPTTKETQRPPAGMQVRNATGDTDRTKRAQAIGNLKNAVTRFEGALQDAGSVIMPGQTKSGLETEYENLTLQMKEFYNLGVLNGPDLALMRRVVNNPTSITGRALAWGSGDEQAKRVSAQVASLKQIIQGFEENLASGVRRPDGTVPVSRNKGTVHDRLGLERSPSDMTRTGGRR